MHRCEDKPDIIIDSQSYQIDTLVELGGLTVQLWGMKGIEFPDYLRTRARLGKEYEADEKERGFVEKLLSRGDRCNWTRK